MGKIPFRKKRIKISKEAVPERQTLKQKQNTETNVTNYNSFIKLTLKYSFNFVLAEFLAELLTINEIQKRSQFLMQ